MIEDLDVYHAAKLLIDRHGADAGLRAAERVDYPPPTMSRSRSMADAIFKPALQEPC
jgi:hypothetical protein